MLWTRILGKRLICIDSYNMIHRANLFGGSDTIEMIRMLRNFLLFIDTSIRCCYDAECRETNYIHIAHRINLAALGWTVGRALKYLYRSNCQ